MMVPQLYESLDFSSQYPKCDKCKKIFSNAEKLKEHKALAVCDQPATAETANRNHDSVVSSSRSNNYKNGKKRSRNGDDDDVARWKDATAWIAEKYKVPRLETEEEIEAWIQERKKKYPTAARMEEKKALLESESPSSPTNTTSANTTSTTDQNERKKVCQNFKRFQRCKFGKECRYLHILKTDHPPPPAAPKLSIAARMMRQDLQQNMEKFKFSILYLLSKWEDQSDQ